MGPKPKGGNMTIRVLSTAVFVVALSGVYAHASDNWWAIQSEQIRKISETSLTSQTSTDLDYNNCSNVDTINLGGASTLNPRGPAPLSPSAVNPLNQVSISQIINIGEQVWSFIQNNRPVVTAKTMSASALPRGVSCWTDLDNWQPPRSETYQVIYRNLFGIQVIKLEFSLIYSYGGQYNGLGRYLMNATVQYRDLQVAWGGFHVSADASVPTVINIGSKENPVAGMQMNVNWTVSGLNHIERTASFFVAGDGRPTREL